MPGRGLKDTYYMSGFFIFLIVIVALWLLWPVVTRWIRAWVMRKLQRQAEDYVRAAAGMPPREETGRSRKRSNTASDTGAASSSDGYYSRRRPRRHDRNEPLIPKEYAVDVEYVEIKEYSETVAIGPEGKKTETREWHESQVTDVEWTEIKNHAS